MSCALCQALTYSRLRVLSTGLASQNRHFDGESSHHGRNPSAFQSSPVGAVKQALLSNSLIHHSLDALADTGHPDPQGLGSLHVLGLGDATERLGHRHSYGLLGTDGLFIMGT